MNDILTIPRFRSVVVTFAVLVLLTVAGCMPAAPQTYSLDPGLSEAQAAAVHDARDQWCEAVGYCPTLAKWSGEGEDGAVVWDFSYERHGKPGSIAFNQRGYGRPSVIVLDAAALEQRDLGMFHSIVMHEFGHHGIAEHVNASPLMTCGDNRDYAVTEIDAAAVAAWVWD